MPASSESTIAGKLAAPEERPQIPPVDHSLGTRLLPALLSVIAGSTDTIGFLGLGGLFTAHITGNLVVLAAHVVSGAGARTAEMLAVPVFMTALLATRLLAGALEAAQVASLRPLLLLQFVLLTLAAGIVAGPQLDPNATTAIIAGMLGVAAMAVQNALVQVSLKGVPTTAVMTTNITRFAVDVGTLLLGHPVEEIAGARSRVRHIWPPIVGFALGCGLGAVGEATMGLRSLILPTALALFACTMGLGDGRGARPLKGQ